MTIVGCDFHPSWQQIAVFDAESGEIAEYKLMNGNGEAERSYRQLPVPSLIGIEACGNSQWLIELLQRLGHEVWIGDAAQIRASYVRKQKTDRRDAAALYAAYDLMVRERRRYFRCSAELPVLLTPASATTDVRCTTINVSSNGMALSTPSPLNPGEEVRIILFLQAAERVVRAIGTVVWDDKHGKTGLSFQCSIAHDQDELQTWLDTQFHDLLTPRQGNL